MNAVAVGPDGSLAWTAAPTPEAAPGEVRIRVAATAVNRADLMQRLGLYPPPPGASPILGLECAGVVDQARGSRFREGDRVCALLAGGGYAEQVAVAEGQVAGVPDGVGLVEAAALPEAWATAWLNLAVEAGLRPNDRLVVHAAASGVGTACLQLARLRGWRTFATAGSPSKLAECARFGADDGADRHGDWAAAVRAWSPDGVDAILDPVGGSYLESNVGLLATGGRLVVIGLMGGTSGRLDLGRVLVKRIRVVGSTLRARPILEKAAVIEALEREVWPAFANGGAVPVIDRIVPITDVEAAFFAVASDATVGKVVLRVGPPA